MEAANPRKGGVMAASRKYPDELRERAIRLVMDLVESPGGPSINGACLRVGEQFGINGDTLRNWVKQARVDAGRQPGVTTGDKTRIAELEREVRELRRANSMADSSGGRNKLCELL